MMPEHGKLRGPPPSSATSSRKFRDSLAVFQYSARGFRLVWSTNRNLTLVLFFLAILSGVVPSVVAWVGKHLVDAVIAGAATHDYHAALFYVVLEAVLVTVMAAAQRGSSVCQSLLRAELGEKVNVLILEKALTLDLKHFEDSEFYDRMTRARREASSRPLSLVMRAFGLMQNFISLIGYGFLLVSFSWWAVLALIVAALPAFFVEARFSGEAFRLFRWRTPEARQQIYFESVLAREDSAKEVMLFGLGRQLLDRYEAIYKKLYAEDRRLTLRRGGWGLLLGTASTAVLYAMYGWIVWAATAQRLSLGEMTMYLLVFKQGQSALSATLSSVGGMYEDNLYLSNLYEFLETPVEPAAGRETRGQTPQAGLIFDKVRFAYPGSDDAALEEISFELKPGQKLAIVGENGSGKTTLIKLLTRLYEPTSGQILLDGTDLKKWDVSALRARTAVIFQDFVRYQMTVGENIGLGDPTHWYDEKRWHNAAELGLAAPFIAELPEQYQTQLGKWFPGGRELSLGQWQKIALSRAFMRKDADILVLDEPTASMDAAAELQIFEHFREVTQNQMVILISHRFSTVRMADTILVLSHGRVLERGTHHELVAAGGLYNHLFQMQAASYQ